MRNYTDEEIEAEHARAPASWRRTGEGEALVGGSDYILSPGESCWITVGNASVYLKHEPDGVSVVLYPLHREDEDAIADVGATWAEFAEGRYEGGS